MTDTQEFPPQTQDSQPGLEGEMTPRPKVEDPDYQAAGKLQGKVALISGGDSGIGAAVAILYAKEGADVAIMHLSEEAEDAQRTYDRVTELGQRCLLMDGDVGDVAYCRDAVDRTVKELGKLDILVCNAAEQHEVDDFADIDPEQIERTFRTNVFGAMYLTSAAMKHLPDDGSIIATTSVTAYEGRPSLVDYSSTKGALVAFVRALSAQTAERGLRVNAVAPGPIWTPLIPASFDADHVAEFGQDTPLGRAGQPYEVAPSYVFLASRDASYITGQVLHPNGGHTVNG